MNVVTVKEPEHLAEMYAIAARHAAVSGVRQQIRYGKFAGRLGPCSDDFDGDFCCGEQPWEGWTWPAADSLVDAWARGPVQGWVLPSDRCPRCRSDRLESLGRIEVGKIPGIDEDATIYHCQTCDHEWDTAMSEEIK